MSVITAFREGYVTTQDERLYSVPEVASRYGVTKRTVRRWCEDGMLPGSKKKGPYEKSRWSIPSSALDALEEARDAVSS
jgi:excisionase family DNA binding protein